MMLKLLILTPLLGSLAIGVVNNESKLYIKQLGLFISMITLLLSIIIWSKYDGNTSSYQFQEQYNMSNFCHLYMGIDGLSLYFILLTTYIIPLCLLSSWFNIKDQVKLFNILFLILESLLIIVFVVRDIILFYIFFESVLIPLFFIIGIWGHGETRIRASYLLFLYTLFGSLFMLLAFLVIYGWVGSTDIQLISLTNINFNYQKYIWLAIFLSFAIKTPLIPFHIWLPKAHAEAPLAGSIILAGLILKLAVYGYLRILINLLPEASSYFTPLVYIICLITIVYSSLTCLRQTDLKALIAYSSIGHMGIVVLGLFSNTLQGIQGGILLSIAHGFVSPALFICVGGVLYDRFHTRVIKYYRGLTVYMPLFSIMLFVFTLSNMAVPLTGNFTGEFMAFAGSFQKSPYITIFAASGMVLSATYSIWLYNRIAFGNYSKYLSYTIDLNYREFLLLLPLLIASIVLGIMPNIILDNLHITVSTFLY